MKKEMLFSLMITLGMLAVGTTACATNSNAREMLSGKEQTVVLTDTALDSIVTLPESDQLSALVRATYLVPLKFSPTGQPFVKIGDMPIGFNIDGEPTPLKPLPPVKRVDFQTKVSQESIPVGSNTVIATYCVPEMAAQIRQDLDKPELKAAILDYFRHLPPGVIKVFHINGCKLDTNPNLLSVGIPGVQAPKFSPNSSGASALLRNSSGGPVRLDVIFNLVNIAEEATQLGWSSNHAVTNVLCDESINFNAGAAAPMQVVRSAIPDERVSTTWGLGCVDSIRGPQFQRLVFGDSTTTLPNWISGLMVKAIK